MENTSEVLSTSNETQNEVQAVALESNDQITAALNALDERDGHNSKATNTAGEVAETIEAENTTKSAAENTAESAVEDIALNAAENAKNIEKISPPASFKPEEAELFAKLPPELRKAVAAKEAEREAFVNIKQQEATEARKHKEEILQSAQDSLNPTIFAVKTVVDGEYAGINWVQLKHTDPDLHSKLSAEYNQRIAVVGQAMNGARQFYAKAQEQANVHEMQRMQEEVNKTLPQLKEIVGENFNCPAFKKDASEYMAKLGAPTEHISGITHGYQLQLIAKAMAFDKMAGARSEAVKKVASAPKVQGNVRSVAADGGNQAARDRAKANILANPNNNDAISAYLATI